MGKCDSMDDTQEGSPHDVWAPTQHLCEGDPTHGESHLCYTKAPEKFRTTVHIFIHETEKTNNQIVSLRDDL